VLRDLLKYDLESLMTEMDIHGEETEVCILEVGLRSTRIDWSTVGNFDKVAVFQNSRQVPFQMT
jgi:hypothetical protein